MNTTRAGKSWYNRITLRGLSIQQRLPLLICVLLSAVILAFSLISYYGVKKASLEIAKNPLLALTGELASMFSKSSAGFVTVTLTAARHDSIKKCIRSGGREWSATVVATEDYAAPVKINRLDELGIWINLVSNAVKYYRKVAEPFIEIGKAAGQGQTVFFVKDNGIGFDPKYSDKLFKVFSACILQKNLKARALLAFVEKISLRHRAAYG